MTMKPKRIKAIKRHITPEGCVWKGGWAANTEPCYVLRQSDVRALAEQYACKRHNGEEAPEAAAQLTDDMLRSCQICGLTVDISKGHCEPTIEFTMQGRTDKKTKKLAELEAQNARLREALVRLDNIYRSELDGEDAPKRPAWLIAALNGEEAST